MDDPNNKLTFAVTDPALVGTYTIKVIKRANEDLQATYEAYFTGRSYATDRIITTSFTLTVVDPCLTTTIIGSPEPADMQVFLQKGNVLQTIANYDDTATQTDRQGGSSLTCGTIAYTLVDSNGAAPTFATVATDGTSLTITGTEDATKVGTHALKLRATLVLYPDIAAKESAFTLTMTDLCLTTAVIASPEPAEM